VIEQADQPIRLLALEGRVMRFRDFPSSQSFVAMCLFGCALLPGCRNEDPETLLTSARDYQAKGDFKAAGIQLRNALRQRPQDASARLMLGQVALQSGDPASAEKELRKALEFGQDPDAVLPSLARAMIELGESEKLIKEFGARKLANPKAHAAFTASLGLAHLRLDRLHDAAESFRSALEIDPELASARLGLARLLAIQGRIDEANQVVDRVVATHPKAVDAWLLQSDLRLFAGDRAGATASLEKAIEADANSLTARFALIQVLISLRDFDAAARQVDAARKLSGDLRVPYFESLIAFGRNDLKKARESAQQVLKIAPDNVPALVLAGAIELSSGQAAAAAAHLRRAVALAPKLAGARRLLVRAYLGTAQPARALETLQPLIASTARIDPALMMLAGETFLANGDLQQASAVFTAASESKDQEPSARTRLGQIALMRGDFTGGIRELEAATAFENAPIQADIALIVGYLRSKDLDRALDSAKAFALKHPKDPMPQQLIGDVHLARKEPRIARGAFERALELNAAYLPAIASLARLDLAEKKPGDARKRFEDLIVREPKNELALLGLAEVMVRTGAKPAEVLGALKRAVAVNPNSVNARLALITFHLRSKDANAALMAAQEADSVLRNDMRILSALGRAQEAAEQPNQAIETYNRMATLDPQATAPLLRLAAVHARQKDFGKSIDALHRAQKVAPSDMGVARDLVLGYLLAGKTEDALKEAKALQKSAPKFAAAYVLEGDIYATTQRWPQAERAYRDGLKADPASETLAFKLHAALVAMNKSIEADALAKKWLADHPKDVTFRNYLAERALRAKNLRAAVTLYESVIAQDPNNVVALNNLAWAAGQLGDPRAIGYAERAVQLAPDSAPALDTLGVLLVAKGDTAKGLENLGRATTLAPDRHDIRFNYAKALVKAGRADEARKQLTALQGVTADFPGKAEIPALLQQI
jgi:putative PEP-CTERM system TPR-repeat lipoprotein